MAALNSLISTTKKTNVSSLSNQFPEQPRWQLPTVTSSLMATTMASTMAVPTATATGTSRKTHSNNSYARLDCSLTSRLLRLSLILPLKRTPLLLKGYWTGKIQGQIVLPLTRKFSSMWQRWTGETIMHLCSRAEIRLLVRQQQRRKCSTLQIHCRWFLVNRLTWCTLVSSSST